MGPSNTDSGRLDDLDDDAASLEHEDAEIVGEFDEDDAAEHADEASAPGRSPSVLSLLLLVAGAIWIVVALLKLGDSDTLSDVPPAAVSADAADAGADAGVGKLDPTEDQAYGELPRVDEGGTQPPPPGQAADEPTPPQAPPQADQDAPPDDPERAVVDDEGNPESERGPPEGSLLAGKVWPRDYAAPEIVHYTIKRGGSMKVVANLYKIYHHEIEALNPGVPIDRELPPATRIVVYKRKPGQRSESVGFPGSGTLSGAMPMIDGPGRELKHTPWKGWGTTITVATLDVILREWARRFPDRQPILVGNMSSREGGRLKPHSSHQSGRDVDLSYPQIWDRKEELNWRKMDSRNLDRELTWSLLEILLESGAVEVIFIDSKLQKLLYEYAVQTGRYKKTELKNWMEYPSPPGTGDPLIQHVRGHDDHIHVRFKCTSSEGRCQSRSR
ncbi:LysM domain protein [Plesiocystis pacifica SIR-1]|uniref:LysM domain protein n=1 Tax=Plesiocystis pacifica SIR-1 TaxID=391625 RepID=A6FXN2_9BACT|nr:penicillin-insensitive murein endopeptidase [Plesiocystis pacifica]EDM81620.1 LysM domain protein [Plesiocystis pacifica SIR-1]